MKTEILSAIAPPKTKAVMKIACAAGTALSVAAVLVAALSGCVLIKLYRCIDSVQKTMPVVKKASQIYIASNTPPDFSEGKKRTSKKASRFRRRFELADED